MSKIAGAGVAVVVLAGTVVGVAGVAQAAPQPGKYAVGSWRLVKEDLKGHGVYRGVKWKNQAKGAAGVKLTIGGTRASFDFSKSKREFLTGVQGRTRVASWTLNRGRLVIAAKVTGNGKGGFATKGKTATGNATGRTVATRPRHRDYGKYSIVSNLRKGNWETLVPAKATFTCTNDKLVIFEKKNFKARNGWGKYAVTHTYRRI